MDSIRKVFAHRMRELRGDMKQDYFAATKDIPLSSLQKYEAGTIPQGDTLKDLVRKLGLSTETELFLDPDLVKRPSPEIALEVIRDALHAPKIASVKPEKHLLEPTPLPTTTGTGVGPQTSHPDLPLLLQILNTPDAVESDPVLRLAGAHLRMALKALKKTAKIAG